MNCIYNKKILCEINPDGPKTKDFICLKCHKPGKKSKNKIIRKQKKNNKTFNVREKNKKVSSKGWRRYRGGWVRRK